MARITAPTPGLDFTIGTVTFVDSVADTDDLAVIGYCQAAGYTVEHDEPEEPEEVLDLTALTVVHLREYAAEHGIDVGDATKKADLVDVISRAAADPIDDPDAERTPPVE